MRTVVQRFFTFHAENTAPEILYALALVYTILLATCIFSLKVSSSRAKGFWLLLMFMLPILGMYCYTLTALIKQGISFSVRKAVFST